MAQIDRHPELWDVHKERRLGEGSPHAQMRDIWVRFRPYIELTEPRRYAEPHFAEFYPAWHVLTELRPIVWRLIERLHPVSVGAILVTRIPPGCEVLPHHDRGTWHAEFYETKVYVPLRSNDECINECGGERQIMRAGEAWFFNNLIEHSVVNRGDTERVTLIICFRCEGE